MQKRKKQEYTHNSYQKEDWKQRIIYFYHFLLISFIFFFLIFSDTLSAQDEIETGNAIERMNQFGNKMFNVIQDSLQHNKDLENFSADKRKEPVRGYAAQLTGIEDLDLPPLEVFMESVYDNGSVKQRTAYQQQMEAEYKAVKNNWMDYFRLQAQYAYGYFYYLNSYYTENIPANTQKAQHSWNIGGNISFSIMDLVNRKHHLKAQRAKIDQAIYQREEIIEERKLKILAAYNNILENLAVLKPRAETVALYNAEMKIAENNYMNGKTTIIELSLERQRRALAIVQYQQGRVALHNAVKTLELLTNIKIIKE